MKKLSYLFILLLITVMGCRKDPFQLAADPAINSTGLRLLLPFTGTSININPALGNTPVVLTWSPATSNTGSPITYKWVAVGKTAGGNIDAPSLSIASDNNGTATKLSLTYASLKAAMEKAGFPLPTSDQAPFEMLWSVVAEDGKTTARSQDVYTINILYNRDGITFPFSLIGLPSSTSTTYYDPASASNMLTFNWTKPTVARPSVNPPKFSVQFYAEAKDGNGNIIQPDVTKAPLFSVTPGNSAKDTFINISTKALSDSITKYITSDLTATVKLSWTVKASSYSSTVTPIPGIHIIWAPANSLYVIRVNTIRLYMPGGYQASQNLGNNWDPPTAPELIRDTRTTNQLYYTYAYLNANDQFKITQGRSWDVNWGQDGAGNLVPGGNNNFKVDTAGIYRISIDRTNLKYDIRLGRMGFVGGAVTGVGWNPPSVFPTSAMAYIARDQFLGIYDFAADGWKMIDNDSWNNGDINVTNTRSYGSLGASGSSLVVNADNMPNIASAGKYRVIWDGSDKNNIKYSLSNGAMYVIGSATLGGWDNNASQNDTQRPPLAYMGNGVWQGSVTLTAGEIKFIVLKGSWDFNYGGSGGKISQGGANIAVSAGTYTITVDEYNQTYTIN
ncbi:MAG: SusF/SusE family outer membrane protein [Sphingobacteriales bacterium]|nr:SusF/SusE family outer membrane protein [Sphingobacteriales bacterium]MBI3719434.1 SusF/SusE family outer membrane protein [Sphingobacteriales bacterium]